jgi:hypothetical protein
VKASPFLKFATMAHLPSADNVISGSCRYSCTDVFIVIKAPAIMPIKIDIINNWKFVTW